MLVKGNVWYTRHYEAYFDRVYVVYLLGKKKEPIINGSTILVSLGGGNDYLNLLMAPFLLYEYAKEIRPTRYLTADIFFSWWTTLLVRLLLRERVYLMPVCDPDNLHATSGSITSLPVWLEKIGINLSFRASHKVVNMGGIYDWLDDSRVTRGKTVVMENCPDCLPSQEFFDALKIEPRRSRNKDIVKLLYVGRLHKEKLVDDLVRMMVPFKEWNGREVSLSLIGDGPERKSLEMLAIDLGVEHLVNFVGPVENWKLPAYYADADIFVSTLTGTSLREAALCGLPIVAYNCDWVKVLLRDEETALLVPSRDFENMALAVKRLVNDEELYAKLSLAAHEFAWKRWSPAGLRDSMKRVFGDD